MLFDSSIVGVSMYSRGMEERNLVLLLQKGKQHKASDVLLKVGQPPGFRVNGALHYLQGNSLTPEQTQALAQIIMKQSRYQGDIRDLQEYDTSYSVDGLGRYRVNVYRQRGSLAIAMRAIPHEVPDFLALGLPQAVSDLSSVERGMILCVGAAGNGKSSTLAAMVRQINATRRAHIVTIEDPIEFVHEDNLSAVSQREVGLDTVSFASALRAALRQDPDVILVGEIRDEETMDIALKAAETGHLVLSTLHTPDVQRTITRMLGLIGDADPKESRERFANILKGVIAQRLLPKADGSGRVVAAEVLVVTSSAKECIRRPANLSLKEVMERGVSPYGMQTFEMALKDMLSRGLISLETLKGAMD